MTQERREQLAETIERAARQTTRAIECLFRHHFIIALVGGIALTLLMPIVGHAQGLPPGPQTFGGYSDQAPLKAGKALVNILMWFMIIVGIVLWCMVPILGPKKGNWFTYAAFGTVALTIGGWIALSHRVGGGDTPEMPDLLGGR